MAADPDEPVDLGAAVDALLPAVDARSAQSPLSIWILPAMVIAAAAIVAIAAAAGGERTGLEGLQQWLMAVPRTSPALAIGTAAFVAAALLFVPVDVLVLVAGFVFGATHGPGVAVAGAAVAAGLGFGAGRLLGPTGVARWISRRAYRSAAQLHGRGVVDIAVLRLSRVAGGSAVDLICGAGRVPFARFIAGTLIAAAPTAVALAGLGGLLRWTALMPSPWHGLLTIGAAMLILAAGAILRTLLLIRQFAPAAAGHRRRSEFG
jgi:uncharacterized membrane protein YdjX (TVP38/TMEM64 family)